MFFFKPACLRDASPLPKVLKNGAIKRKLLPSLSRSKDYETRLNGLGHAVCGIKKKWKFVQRSSFKVKHRKLFWLD